MFELKLEQVLHLSQHTFNPVTESLSNNMNIYSIMFIFSGGIYLFLLNHVLAVLQQMVPRNSRNAFLHPTPLQQFFALPNKPSFSPGPESAGARGHYRNIPSTCSLPKLMTAL